MFRTAPSRSNKPFAVLVLCVLISTALHGLILLIVIAQQRPLPHTATAPAPSDSAKLSVLSKTTLPEKSESTIEQPKFKPKPKPIPLIFVETDSSQPTGEVPEDTKYYSTRTTVAANPEVDLKKLGSEPFMKGGQDKVMSTADVPLVPSSPNVPSLGDTPAPPRVPDASAPAQPTFAAPEPTLREQPPIPKPELATEKVQSSDNQETPQSKLAMRVPLPDSLPQVETKLPPQPAETPSSALPTPSVPSVRNIPARQSRNENSSVARRGTVSISARGTPLGIYDQKVVAAVRHRWHLLLASQYFGDRSGYVVIYFVLMEDGTVRDLRIEEETVGPVLAGYCQAAIVGSAPFDPFPSEVRQFLGKDHREIQFTFYY